MRPTEKYRLPYDDNKLVYDYEQHRYLLSDNFILSRYPDITPSKELVNAVSDNVYLFIYSFKQENDYDIMEYELACNTYMREWIAEALLRQYEYAFTTNGDIVSLQHGIDLSNQKSLKVEDLRNELFVSYKTYLILYIHGFLKNSINSTDFTEEKYREGY